MPSSALSIRSRLSFRASAWGARGRALGSGTLRHDGGARRLLAGLALGWLGVAPGCGPAPEPTDEPPAALSWCEEQGWTERAFIEEAAFGPLRRDVADDFWVETSAGRWDFADEWTGCESYLFISDSMVVSPLDATPLLEKTDDIVGLIDRSPPNVHYFFMAEDEPGLGDFIDGMERRVEDALDELDDEERAWWAPRLHIVTTSVEEQGGWVDDAMDAGGPGFGIDRFQRVRGIGQLADVNRYSSALNSAGAWPWEANLAYIAHEAQYYNYRSDLQDRLDAVEWDVHHLWVDENIAASGQSLATVELPDAATMAGYDTLWVDLRHACDPTRREFGNCDAWDAGNRLHLCTEDAEDPDELDCEQVLARWITTYHREGRWLVDVSQMLPLLAEGGQHTLQYRGARGGHFTTVRLLLAETGKEGAPFAIEPAFEGGSWSATYDEEHPPIEIDVPADAERVWFHAFLSGHGQGGSFNCAEFCDHQHSFMVGGRELLLEHPDMGEQEGCLNQIDQGTVPNQHGTWWFERSSWCPGKQVDPWVFDITDQVTPGERATISYTTNWGDPVSGGNINLQSFVTYWR